MKRIDTTCIILIHLYEWMENHTYVCLYTCYHLNAYYQLNAYYHLNTLGMIHISIFGTIRRNGIILI